MSPAQGRRPGRPSSPAIVSPIRLSDGTTRQHSNLEVAAAILTTLRASDKERTGKDKEGAKSRQNPCQITEAILSSTWAARATWAAWVCAKRTAPSLRPCSPAFPLHCPKPQHWARTPSSALRFHLLSPPSSSNLRSPRLFQPSHSFFPRQQTELLFGSFLSLNNARNDTPFENLYAVSLSLSPSPTTSSRYIAQNTLVTLRQHNAVLSRISGRPGPRHLCCRPGVHHLHPRQPVHSRLWSSAPPI